MPTTVLTATNFLAYDSIADNGTTLSWGTSVGVGSGSIDIVDENDDGNIDSTGVQPDYMINTGTVYTGYTININGNDYAIFSDGTNAIIPYDAAFEDLSGQELTLENSSTTTQAENTQPVNFCFVGGTMIATPEGDVAVEDLKIGDLVTTADGQSVPVKWIGRQAISAAAINVAMDEKLAMVRIEAGALDNTADLYVSADHGMIVDGLVINASALVNGTTIDFVPSAELPREFTYYHVETEAHDVILANGAQAETFIDVAGRTGFDNHQEYLDLYGTERVIPEMPQTRISSQRLLPEAIRQRLGIATSAIEIDTRLTA